MPKQIIPGLSLPWYLCTGVRNFLYDRNIFPLVRLKIKVLSVGSLRWGGGGKTSLVIALAAGLKEKGRRVAVVSHGYQRSSSGTVVCGPGSPEAGVETLGDEGFLIWKKTGVTVAAATKKWRAALALEKAGAFDVILVDDGFQHRRLHRDLDIVLTGPEDGEGLRREPASSLSRARVIVHTVWEPSPSSRAPRCWEECGHIYIERINRLAGVINQEGGQLTPPAPVNAICGLGDPASFAQSLSESGYSVIKKACLKDHQPFPSAVLEMISGDRGAWVTTEKDAVRIPAGQFPRNLYTARLDCAIPEEFLQYLQLLK